MDDKGIYQWGAGAPMAPTARRADIGAWLSASACAGLVAAAFALAAVWRPFPWLPAPPGALSEHLLSWGKLLVHLLARSAFQRDAAAYLDFLAGLSAPDRVALLWRCAVAVWCACMPAVLLAPGRLTPRDKLIHMRGSRRLSGEEAERELKAALAPRVRREPDHEIAPGIAYPSHKWTRHVLVVGGTGSGKSTILKPIVQRIVEAREQIILFDPKGEFTIGFGAMGILAPWDKRSLAWDIARDMRNLQDMRRFAAAMIRESQDPMWSSASRQLLVGLMVHLKGTRGTRWGWADLAGLLSKPQVQLLDIMLEWHPEAVRAVEKASVTTAGILINLASFCSSIFDLAEAWGSTPEDRRVSFVEWTKGKSRHRQIILQGHGAYAELTKSYVEGIVGIFSAIVNSVEMEDDPKRKLWLVADELPQMGEAPLRPLLEVGRSRGVRCVLACQDLAQLEEIYGAQMLRAMVSLCGTLMVGQMMQGETADQLCKWFGAREVERPNVSTALGGQAGGGGRSETLSFAREEVALYKPSELTSRLGETPDGKGVVFVLFTEGNAYELFWPRYQLRRERMGHMPASWTYGAPKRYARMAAVSAPVAPADPAAASKAPGVD